MQGLRPCSDIPTHKTPAGDDCFDDFVPQMLLGTGAQGAAIEVVHKQHKLVAKILPFDDNSIREVQVQCALNALHDQTGVFTHAFGYQVCSEIPEDWANYIDQENLELLNRYIVIIMERGLYDLKDWKKLRVKPDEFKAIAFLVLHGIYEARKALQFAHDDLHIGNIMLQVATGPVHVRIGSNAFTVDPNYPKKHALRYVPKIIDFGYSEIGEESKEESDDMFASPSISSDLADFAFALERVEVLKPLFASQLYMEAKNSSRSDARALERLLNGPFFASYRNNNDMQLGKRCVQCLTKATSRRTSDGLYFCAKACSDAFFLQ